MPVRCTAGICWAAFHLWSWCTTRLCPVRESQGLQTYRFACRLAYVTEATVALVVGVVAGGAGTAEEAEATPCCSRVVWTCVLLLPCSTCLSVPAIPAAFLYYSWWRGERLPSSLVELNTEVGLGTSARHLVVACGLHHIGMPSCCRMLPAPHRHATWLSHAACAVVTHRLTPCSAGVL